MSERHQSVGSTLLAGSRFYEACFLSARGAPCGMLSLELEVQFEVVQPDLIGSPMVSFGPTFLRNQAIGTELLELVPGVENSGRD
jgi:hypothetical protein